MHSAALALSPCYSTGRLLDALTLSLFTSHSASWRSVERQGSAGRIIFSSSSSGKKEKFSFTLKGTKTGACGAAVQKHQTHTGPPDKMWIISLPTSAARETKKEHMRENTHTCTHVYANSHASSRGRRSAMLGSTASKTR